MVAEDAEDAEVVVINTNCSDTPRILLQFHITGRCNLRCKHCYRSEGDVEALSFSDISSVIEQFIKLKHKFNINNRTKRKGHINITGGEPFIREDIKDILRLLGSKEEHLTYGILSNGSFIDDETINLLKETKVSFVQLSIDGNKETHDSLRENGDYERVFATAEHLETKGITTYISFTANKDNFCFLPEVAKECRKRKISKLWTDRLVPIGSGQTLSNLAITKDEMPSYISAVKKAQGNILTQTFHPKTKVTANRALQFLGAKGEIYSCSAGNSLITVDEFGNIMPCRRMPIKCGNIFSSTLSDIYFENETFKSLRLPYTPKSCSGCKFAHLCSGGARCQSFALTGSYFKADPACFLKTK